MKVYLVRHGETDQNIARRHQPEKTPMAKNGFEQAVQAAEYFKNIKPTKLISSNMVRAIETARIIGEACDLVPEINHRFAELSRPKNMYGYHHGSLPSLLFYLKWALNFKSTSDNGSESYKSLRQRLNEAKEFLANHDAEDKIVVVSHSVFINMFLAHLCRDKGLNPWQGVKTFKEIITMPNGHITALEFDPHLTDNTCGWSVQS